MPEDLDAVIAAVLALPAPPVAFEAMWDGDTQGWSLTLLAVSAASGGYAVTYLHTVENGGDIRLFNGQVPPWPEAEQAQGSLWLIQSPIPSHRRGAAGSKRKLAFTAGAS